MEIKAYSVLSPPTLYGLALMKSLKFPTSLVGDLPGVILGQINALKGSTGVARRMNQENLMRVQSSSQFAPKKGWALYERPPPSRLNVEARAYLVELFQGGKEDKNRRVSAQEAESLLHEKFPTQEDAWLSAKQCKSLFSRLAKPDIDEEMTEEELVADYENAEAEEILHSNVVNAKKGIKKRNKVKK